MARILKFNRQGNDNVLAPDVERRRGRGREDATVSDVLALRARSDGMKLIPWGDIWSSLNVARIRGNGEMIKVFYDTLFEEAVFDDRGAWSLDVRKRN